MLRISIQSACWYQKDDPDASFAFIRSCGFEAVDFGIDSYLPVRKSQESGESPASIFDQDIGEILERFTPVKQAAERHEIGFAQMHAPFPVWIPENEPLTEYVIMAVEKCLAVCKHLDCPALVVHPFRCADKDEEFASNMELFRRLIPAAQQSGVKICIENLPLRMNGRLTDGVCNDAGEVCQYIDTLNAEAGCEAFGYCFDVGHANLMGCNIYDHLKKVGDRLSVLHIHDNNGIADWHTAPFTCVASSGHQTDWEGLIQGLQKICYRGDLNFETFRVLKHLPPPLRKDMLCYIASVGRYFRDRILENGTD